MTHQENLSNPQEVNKRSLKEVTTTLCLYLYFQVIQLTLTVGTE